MLHALLVLLVNGLLFLACLLLGSFFVVLVHELGHAIPLLFMSRKKVAIYIGSFGDPKRSVRGRIGRLEIWIKYNPFLWFRGLCKGSESLSPNRTILYISTGPLASVLLAIASGYLLTNFKFGGVLMQWLFFTLIYSLAVVFSSFFRTGKQRYSSKGSPVYPDFVLIARLFRLKRFPPEYGQAVIEMGQRDFARVSDLLEKMIQDGFEHPEVYRLLLVALLQGKNLGRGQQINSIIKEKYPLTADDYCNDGYILSHNKQHEQAIISYSKAIELAPDHISALNNFGYSLILADRVEEAISHFDKVIRLAPQFAYSHNNRGWAKMKIGKWEEGLADVNYSLKLDDTNADAYKNLGLYQLEQQNFDAARTYFEKARQMDESVFLIDEYLAETDRLQFAAKNLPVYGT
jgi:tetratricopeptide (TPR) repeat protein